MLYSQRSWIVGMNEERSVKGRRRDEKEKGKKITFLWLG